MKHLALAAAALFAAVPAFAQVVVNPAPYAYPTVGGQDAYGRSQAYGGYAQGGYGTGGSVRASRSPYGADAGYGGYRDGSDREDAYGRQEGRRRYGDPSRNPYARPEADEDDKDQAEAPVADPSADRTRRVERDGRARVVASDTLVVDGFAFKLSVDGPSPKSVCLDTTGQSYRCGQQAAVRLEKLVSEQRVRCEGIGDPAVAVVGTCRVGRSDLGRIMVRDGWAQSSGLYAPEEQEAKLNRRGMWSGSGPRP